LEEYNEGLGVVYERLVLNDYLQRLMKRYPIERVLEAPIYGMAGVTGINSVPLAQRGCQVTLVDTDAQRLKGVEGVWRGLGLPCKLVRLPNLTSLPFPDGSFELAWNWAALWYLDDVPALLGELARVSKGLVFVAMPNRWQIGYWLRKHLIDKEFFTRVDERWVEIERVKSALRGAGLEIIEQGVLDIPPWPDTVMPAAEVIKRLGINSKRLEERFTGEGWRWSTMDYYLDRKPNLMEEVRRYTWLERLPLPWRLKLLWAHHRYVLGRKVSV
jgi:hypothetical protein